MPQGQLPIFPVGLTLINNQIGFQKKGDTVYYFHGYLPVFHHHADDLASFRLITSLIVDAGNAKQVEIVNAFGVTSISVKRSAKTFREKGARGFFETKRTRGPHVLTVDVLDKLQRLLHEGMTIPEVARKMGLKADTLHKAVNDGRLKKGGR